MWIHGRPPGYSLSEPPHALDDGIIFWSNIYLEDQASPVGGNSGVDTDSLMVTVRDRSGNIVVPPVQGIYYSGDVFGVVIPFTFDPYGSYTFDVSFKDNVGNLGGFSKAVTLDSRGPHAEVLLHASSTITAGMTLNGVAGDIEHIWQSRSMHLHFEQPEDTTTFIDPSRNEFLATCDLRDDPDGSDLPPAMQAQCPTAGVDGKYASGVSFDGDDDRLVVMDSVGVSVTDAITTAVEARLSLYNSSFTVMAWVNADDWSGNRAVLGTDPTEDSEALFVGFEAGKPALGYAGKNTSGTDALPTGTWKHVTWRFDMDSGEQSVFVDGVLQASQANRDPYAGLSNTIYVGRAADTDFFSGMLDEIAVYPLAFDRRYHL